MIAKTTSSDDRVFASSTSPFPAIVLRPALSHLRAALPLKDEPGSSNKHAFPLSPLTPLKGTAVAKQLKDPFNRSLMARTLAKKLPRHRLVVRKLKNSRRVVADVLSLETQIPFSVASSSEDLTPLHGCTHFGIA